MATTKTQLSEQILRLLNSGDVTHDNAIDGREILLAVEQERDRLIRQRLMESMQRGEGTIPGDVISAFDSVKIKKDNIISEFLMKNFFCINFKIRMLKQIAAALCLAKEAIINPI